VPFIVVAVKNVDNITCCGISEISEKFHENGGKIENVQQSMEHAWACDHNETLFARASKKALFLEIMSNIPFPSVFSCPPPKKARLPYSRNAAAR
jgi:hypothetical protein